MSWHGAYLSHILADLAFHLGSKLTAKAFTIDSYQLAEDAGHNELCAGPNGSRSTPVNAM
jgi:hypothetical protein